MEKDKVSPAKNPVAPRAPATKAPVPAAKAPAPVASPAPPQRVPPLFRRIDWLAMVVTFLVVFVGYCLTLAPEMTLEDSGELAVGSFYAGIPHPPGYPVWTIFTWFWSLLPFGNVAWRVALGSAFAGALSSGMLGLVVSRGSSMIIESIDDLKGIERRWENALCLISGFVAGALIGFNGYMWSQAVIVEVYPLSVVSLMGVVVCLLRWVYAPHQHRYLFWAFFSYGICFNNHQSLLVIAMGMEVLIWMAEPKLGRELFFWNTVLYAAGLAIRPSLLAGNIPVFVIFNLIGIASLVLWVWLSITTKKKGVEFARDGAMLAMLLSYGLILGKITSYTAEFAAPLAEKAPAFILDTVQSIPLLVIAAAGTTFLFVWLVRKTLKFSREWLVTLACGGSWLVGAFFYLYMPIAGMTNPPMQWGYPRTLDGFIHAITRGQYDKIHPLSGEGGNAFEVVGSFFAKYAMLLWRFIEGLNDEFNFLYLLIALAAFLFYRKMKRRERVWIIGMAALFICVGPFLIILLNFSSDRQSLELNRVFLTSSHVFVAMGVGYGLTLLGASMAAHFDSLRKVSLFGGVCALDFALFILAVNSQVMFDPDKSAFYGFMKMVCWLVAITSVIILWRKGLEHDRLLALGLPGVFVLSSFILTLITFFGDPPSRAGIGKVFSAIGRSFSPDQYGLHIHAALILIAASVVFLVAAWVNRSKAPVAITLVLFALMPSYSIMIHWFNNEQRGHYFGYWFGHDMFTPPFVGPDGKITYDAKLRAEAMKGPRGSLVYPEMTRDAILFGGTDPGRFAPTYMIFCDSFIPRNCKPEQDREFDRRDVYIITQNALADGTYLNYIRAHYYRSDQLKYDTPFFQELLRAPIERDPGTNYRTNFLAAAANKLLDRPLIERGARIEARWRKEGVYPRSEIYTPTHEDSQKCFRDYTGDAARRLQHDAQFPNEPKQVRPGEGVVFTDDGKVQVSGQIAVMAINGLLTKVIFDHNPTNEFFVEESFPLEWMYPHLTPFGVIMKINRQQLPEITEDIAVRDHEFWAKYSERLIGNWITYDTPVKDIAEFAERVYLRHDFTGFKGDRKFVRDDQAQKAFSKLRSSIAGIYAWRLGLSAGSPTPANYVAKGDAERQRMIREADFAFRQAFAFCPYSPEAVFRYVNLLASLGRLDDALLIAETCQKLDPYNGQVLDLVKRLKEVKNQPDMIGQIQKQIKDLEAQLRANPNDFQKSLDLAFKYYQIQQSDRTIQVLDGVLNNPEVNVPTIFAVAQFYAEVMHNVPKLQNTMEKLVQVAPDQPEAWYNLAATKVVLGNTAGALQDLKRCFELNTKRLATDSRQHDLKAEAEKDARFAGLRALPEYKTLTNQP